MRKRQRTVVLGVLVAHLALISAQVDTSAGTSVLHNLTFGLLAELQRAATSTATAAGDFWRGYVSLRDVHRENVRLQEAVADLELTLQEQDAQVRRARSLERLLRLDEESELITLGARVIGGDATPWFRTVTVGRGALHGVRPDLAVIAPDGVVGRVVGDPGMRAAQVQLLVDRNAAAGAVIERTGVPGVVGGAGDGSALRMDYVSNLEDVRVGDAVVTSGTDGIYPPGFTIGTVLSAAHGTDLYKSIRVEPAIRFDRLDHVLIVTHDDRLAVADEIQ